MDFGITESSPQERLQQWETSRPNTTSNLPVSSRIASGVDCVRGHALLADYVRLGVIYGGLEGHSASGSGAGPGRVRVASGAGPGRVGAGPGWVRGGSVRRPSTTSVYLSAIGLMHDCSLRCYIMSK